MKVRLFAAILAVLAFIQISCDREKPSPQNQTFLPSISHTESLSGWEYKQWIGKVARLLRQGRGLDASDDIEVLSKLSREEVIAHFMKDPAFANMVLDFNLYFLGLKNGPLFTDKAYVNPQALYMGGTIASARETFNNGNFLKLLDWEQPLYLNPMRRSPFPMGGGPTPSPGAESEKLRESYIEMSIKSMDKTYELVKDGYTKNFKEFCKVMLAPDGPFNALSSAGMPINLFLQIRGTPNWFGDVYLPCTNLAPVYDAPSDDVALRRTKAMLDVWPKVIELVREIPPTKYEPTNVMEMKEVNLAELVPGDKHYQFNRGSFILFLNSSTNFNRKRAAFVLKRYFCDDLTPIAVEAPAFHGQGAHASEPACQACHYKLDPMAGFFKDLGYGGYPMYTTKKVMFDDLALADVDSYKASWKPLPGQTQKWNIGYIRSNQFQKLNEYGERIEDLVEIIKKAPEVKQCIVRRASQYILGEGQMLDAGFLAYLSKNFIEEAKANSAQAFKSTLARLLTSNTFQQGDAKPEQCYDFAPGESPEGRPPCRVAKLLETSCAQCHGANALGGLNILSWVPDKDGKLGFQHIDDQGNQISVKESLGRFLSRLETADSKKRMPLNKYMSDVDRAELVLWATDYAKGVQQ